MIDLILEKATSDYYDYYDKQLMDAMTSNTVLGKIIRYRNVKRPKYLEILLPSIEKHYDAGYFEGYLLTFKKVRLFRIGTKIEKEPVYKKVKVGSKIEFSRYSNLETKTQ